jgi:hypothetical protein
MFFLKKRTTKNNLLFFLKKRTTKNLEDALQKV